ncbi:MAG TPA: sugar kinase [Puia sp.]|nr:sugar kinase [Puia sp.]
MGEVICFGELLLRMSPALGGEWLRQANMPVYIGGSELNVATALARWDIPVKYFTAMPDHYLSKEIVDELQKRKIDTSPIYYSGKRIGIYFLPQGKDLKHAGVIYDRAHSSFGELKPGMIDWEKKLENISWFHFSAISPALNENVAAVCREVLEVASRKKIKISIDLNYRTLLWQYVKDPAAIMPGLVRYCDVVMGNIWSANSLLGIPVDPDIHSKARKEDYLDHAKKTSLAIIEQFPKCTTVANTFRFDDSRKGLVYYSSLFHQKNQYNSYEFTADKIIDKVGTGDCFMAGLIYGLYHDHLPEEIVNFATSAAFGKFNEIGDTTKQDTQTIQSRLMTYG